MKQPKVVLATVGSYGDLHPFMAIALELKALGVRPVIATALHYREKIEREGIGFHAVSPDVDMITRDTGLSVAGFATQVTQNSVEFLFRTFILPYLAQACADTEAAVADADLVVVSSFAMSAQIVAEALGKPSICVPLQPGAMMSSEDPSVLQDLPALPAIGRLLGPGFVSWLYAQGRRRFRTINADVEVRRRAYGLPLAYGDAMVDGAYRADETFALYSPIMGGARRDPPVPTTLGGFAFFDRDHRPGEALSPEAQAFLAVDEAPIVFTLGSFGVLAAGRFYEEAVAASRALGRRAVLLVGRDDEARLRASLGADDMLVLGYAPHSRIFSRCAAIVHHGGIGTTGQALRSGAPQLVCPMFGDQPDNAYRVKRLGVGDSLPFRKFNGPRAARALKPLLNDPAIGARARLVASTVGQENGARVLAEHIVRRLGQQ